MTAPLVMLHGVNGCGEALAPLSERLRSACEVITPNLIGHGGRPLPAEFSVAEFAADVVQAMDARGVRRAWWLGYSFGGYLALYIARHYPERVLGVCTPAAKIIYDAAAVQHLMHLTDPERVGRPGNPRAAIVEKMHQPQDWRALLRTHQRMFLALGQQSALDEQDFHAIAAPALIVSGDDDQIVPSAEAATLSQWIPGAQLVTYTGYSHPLEVVPLDELASTVAAWMRAQQLIWFVAAAT